jgi:hypothetical protein
MTTEWSRPSTIDGIKRLAKRIKAAKGIQPATALDEAAKLAGFNNFAHAAHHLPNASVGASGAHENPPPIEETRPESRSDFHQKTRATWVTAINEVGGPASPSSMTWRGLDAIMAALTPFVGPAYSHAHLPTGGGMDFLTVAPSHERGCLEFEVSERMVYLMKPRALTLERIDLAPAESFLILELDELRPSGVYERRDDGRYERSSEELVEIEAGEYLDREIWDRGFLDIDEDGREVPIPRSARLMVRWFRGKVLIVVKGSLWNGTAATYDGRHNKMSAAQIREVIERSILRSA